MSILKSLIGTKPKAKSKKTPASKKKRSKRKVTRKKTKKKPASKKKKKKSKRTVPEKPQGDAQDRYELRGPGRPAVFNPRTFQVKSAVTASEKTLFEKYAEQSRQTTLSNVIRDELLNACARDGFIG